MNFPINFLNFDGVMRRLTSAPYRLDDDLIASLESLLRRFKTLNVVFSTTWRLANSIEQLRQPFASDLRARIIGVTPDHDSSRDTMRYREILD